MEVLEFSYNWNNKLGCKAFTTLRLRNDNKYFIGAEYEVSLKRKGSKDMFDSLGTHTCIEIKHLTIFQINEFIARLDTGYNRDECIKLIQTMYKNIVTNWNTQQLSLILLIKKV